MSHFVEARFGVPLPGKAGHYTVDIAVKVPVPESVFDSLVQLLNEHGARFEIEDNTICKPSPARIASLPTTGDGS